MAQLGVRSFSELIGRTELLDIKKGNRALEGERPRLLADFQDARHAADVARYNTENRITGSRRPSTNRLIELARPALDRGEKVSIDMPIRNGNRTVGTMLSHEDRATLRARGVARGHDPRPVCRVRGPELRGVPRQRRDPRSDRRLPTTIAERASRRAHHCFAFAKFRGEPTENIITGNVVLYGAIAGTRISAGVPASVSPCATPAPLPSSRASETTAANT